MTETEARHRVELTDEEKQIVRECLCESFSDAKEFLKLLIELLQRTKESVE